MSDNEQLVRRFCDAFARRDVDELLGFFADDAVYHNIPLEPAHGKDAIRATLEAFVPGSPEIDFEIRNVAEGVAFDPGPAGAGGRAGLSARRTGR